MRWENCATSGEDYFEYTGDWGSDDISFLPGTVDCALVLQLDGDGEQYCKFWIRLDGV
jgi:hypothetical protein